MSRQRNFMARRCCRTYRDACKTTRRWQGAWNGKLLMEGGAKKPAPKTLEEGNVCCLFWQIGTSEIWLGDFDTGRSAKTSIKSKPYQDKLSLLRTTPTATSTRVE